MMELERDKLAVIDEKTEIAIEVCVSSFIVIVLTLNLHSFKSIQMCLS